MNRYEFVAMIITIPTIATTVVALAYMYFKRAQPLPGAGRQADERLARIEQAVDSIAVEVERISEAQRFTARIMAEARRPEALPVADYKEGRLRG